MTGWGEVEEDSCRLRLAWSDKGRQGGPRACRCCPFTESCKCGGGRKSTQLFLEGWAGGRGGGGVWRPPGGGAARGSLASLLFSAPLPPAAGRGAVRGRGGTGAQVRWR